MLNFIYTNGQELQAAAGWCMFSFQQLKNIEQIFQKDLNKWLIGTSTLQKEDEKSSRSEQLQQEQGIEQQDENQSKQQFEKTNQSQTESPNQIQIGIVDQKNLADQNSASKEEHDQIQGQDTQLSAEVNSEKKYRVNKGEQVHEQQQSSEQDKETSQGSGKQPGNLNTSDKSGDAVDEKIYPLSIQFCKVSGSASKISIDSFQCLQCQHNIEYVGPTENIKRTQNQGYISDSIKCRTCKTVHNLFVQLGELVNMKAFVSLQQLTKQKIQDWISKSQAIPVEKVAIPKEEIITKYCDSKNITKKNVLQFPCIKCSQQVNHSLDKNYSEGQQIKAQCKSCKSELFIIQTLCHATFISNKSILDLNDPVLCPNHCCYLNLKCQCQQFIGYLTIQDSLKLENKFFHTISCPNKQCKWKKIHYFKCELCKQKNLTEIILQFGAEPNFGAEIACSNSKFPHPIYVYAQCPSNDCGLVNFIKDYKMGELRKCAGSQCKQQFSLVTCQQCSQAIYLENQYEEMTLVECECGNQFTMFFCRGKDCCAPIQINELHKNSQIQKFYACSKCKEQNLLLFCANCDQHTIICKYDFKRQYRCANCKRQIGLKYSEQSQKIELISPFENDENPERPDYTQYGRMEEEDLPQNQGQYAGSKPFKSQSDNSYDPHQYQNYEGTWTGVHPGLEKMEMKNQAWGSKVI